MAGLIGLTASDMEIQDALGARRWAYDGDWIPHPVVRLTTTLPVAVNAPDGERDVVRARWGFPVGPRPVGNARDDKLASSPMWSKMLGNSPCLLAATGIYEMIKTDAGKQAYWFRRRDGRPIVMPGLCRERTLHERPTLCAAIVTTEPNPFFARYHARQVCELEDDAHDAWMSAGPDEALDLVRAPPAEAWEAVPVDARIFGKGRRELEDLVPVGEPETIETDPEDVGRPAAGPGQRRLM